MSAIQGDLFDAAAQFAGRATRDVTFKGKLALPVHHWYRMTDSFSPKLADDIADHFRLGPADTVLDPFSGVGTVPLCMRNRGVPACAVEITPFMHFVSIVKCRVYRDVPGLRRFFADCLDRVSASCRHLPQTPAGRAAWLREHADLIPLIHHPERWWSPANLAQLMLIRRAALELPAGDDRADLLRLGILVVLIPVINARHNHVSLTFADEALPEVDVAAVLRAKLDEIADDLTSTGWTRPAPRIVHGNSKSLTDVLPAGEGFTSVITSPPYPNRFSYARETRPHLFFFDFIKDARAVGQLEVDPIGGTWGKATSVLIAGVTPAGDKLARLLAAYTGRVAERGRLMASYVTKYFNDLDAHAAEVAAVCPSGARLAYVIGNSKFYGEPLPTDDLLAAVFSFHGFRTDGIERMRRRQSKVGLYEAVVFMSRP